MSALKNVIQFLNTRNSEVKREGKVKKNYFVYEYLTVKRIFYVND